MTLPQLDTLCELVRNAAVEELLPRFANVTRERKPDGSIVTVADRSMQDRLQSELKQRWPKYRLLGEEMTAVEQAELIAAPGDGFWILDPVDGTSNFSTGIPYFSVSLALMAGGTSVLGLVYDPSRDECFSADVGTGARLNGQPLKSVGLPSSLERGIAAVDFKRLPPELATRFAIAPPYSSQRSFGSIALDWCWVAAGRFHVYLHGKQMIWDYAAGHLILKEMGGRSCTLEGEPVFNANGEPRSALAALDHELFDAWSTWIKENRDL